MRVLPLFYNSAFSDADIMENECSDRIWCNPDQFRQFTEQSEPGITTLLHLTNMEGVSLIGCVYGVHNAPDKDTMYVPNWMYQELGDDSIIIEKAQPNLCSRLKLQPHTSEHLSADDPQELFRDAFEKYSCLTPGSIIPLWIGKQITVSIVELGPTPNSTLCIRNCELELELMRPLDMPDEPPYTPPPPEPTPTPAPTPSPPANTIVDTRPRHVIMAEAAKRRLAAQATIDSS